MVEVEERMPKTDAWSVQSVLTAVFAYPEAEASLLSLPSSLSRGRGQSALTAIFTNPEAGTRLLSLLS